MSDAEKPMTEARENELADRLEARADSLDENIAKLDCGPLAEALKSDTDMIRLAASTLRANAERIKALEEALETAVRVAGEARREWDAAPSGMKAGKLLSALADSWLMYRADITVMHAARAARSNANG